MASFLDKLKKKKVISKDDRDSQEAVGVKDAFKKKEEKEELPAGASSIDVDIYQSPSELVVYAQLPGVSSEDLDISLEGDGDILLIRADKKRPDTREEEKETVYDKKTLTQKISILKKSSSPPGSFISQECKWGQLYRKIDLPVEIVPGNVGAKLDRGILTIRLSLSRKSGNSKIKVSENNE